MGLRWLLKRFGIFPNDYYNYLKDRKYTSRKFTDYCSAHNVTQSMSRAGCPYDNAPMERYFNTLKNELIYQHSLFQVASIMTTAGYTTTDYDVWPMLAKTVLVVVMFIGAMAGSTAGGIKVSRIVIAIKGAYINIRKLINPRYVSKAKFEGKTLEPNIINDVFAFITLYFFIFLAGIFLLSFDSVNGTMVRIVSDAGSYEVEHGFFSNFSAVLTCISNVGPAFEAVGPYSGFAGYNDFSTVVLTFIMMLGRLEILPVLILFNRRTWQKV